MPSTNTAPHIKIDLVIKDQNWDAALNNLALSLARDILDCTSTYLTSEISCNIELGLILTDNAEIQDLNARYRNKDKPTNILSFSPFSDAKDYEAAQKNVQDNIQDNPDTGLFIGDLILSYDVMAKEAQAQNKPLAHHYQHLITHGFLHLLGYDHDNDQKAKEMETLEIEILNMRNIPNPYDPGS